MRLMIVGGMGGPLGTAGRIAMERGAKITNADSIEQAMEIMRGNAPAQLVMIDVGLDVDAMVTALNAEHINAPVIAAGIGADTRKVVAAMKAGAKEYIPLPPDPDLIAAVLEAVTDDSRALLYADPAMNDVMRLADQIAPSNANVLITGESGTGKEVLARYIHDHSGRSGRSFVAVNCAAIPENLLESELFGHEKGAFTGAVARRLGKFEEADGGTLLLDEISEMDVRLQSKLLRALQEREIDRIGGNRPVKVDTRVLATSNRDLAEEVKAGRFREDLMFRLNVVNLRLPPLRERPGDIPVLVEHFVAKYTEMNQVPARPLAPEVMSLLQGYGWPGNVRELENTMHRAVLLATGAILGPEAVVLPDGKRLDQAAPTTGGTRISAPDFEAPPLDGIAEQLQDAGEEVGNLVGKTVAEVERDLIIDTLKHCLGNRTHAANILGISIRTLRNKLKQYSQEGVPIPAPGGEDRRVAP